MYQVLSFNHSIFITAERCRVAAQFNKTLALGVERLKPEVDCGIVWLELIFPIYLWFFRFFILSLCKRINRENSVDEAMTHYNCYIRAHQLLVHGPDAEPDTDQTCP